ncbi:MAG: hypothetical protein R3D45_04765 [Rhizobiaceae bacterium]
MKRTGLVIHLIALATLFATLGQPYAAEKPAGVRRAIETVAKSGKAVSANPILIVSIGGS